MLALSRSQLITLFLGLAIIILVILSEVLSSSANGIGPYQAILIIFGVLIIWLGLVGSDSILGKVALVMLSIVISVMLVEGILLILSRANVKVTYPDVQELVEDDILGKRTPPNAVGHDARGWRNAVALDEADIVTIGDSQTWGVNVSLVETYPSVLSELTGYEVYSMAQGSYGAVQYRVLAEQAVELSPQLVVIGMYFGNDFADAYNLVYGDYAHQSLRDSSFDLTAITQTITEQATKLQPSRLIELGDPKSSNQAVQSFDERLRSGTYIGRLLTNLGVFDAVDMVEVEVRLQENKTIVTQSPTLFDIYDKGRVLTFLTPAYRHLVMDTESSIIAEGVRLSKIQYKEIKNLLTSVDIELLIVFIPTKEYVYLPYMEPDLSDAYHLLGEQESLIRQDMMDFFDTNDISYVDSLPVLREAVENDVAIYPESFDGHPNSNGYRIIAGAVADSIRNNAIMK